MDPLSAIASITGILAFAAKAAQTLNTMIADIRDAPDDIVDVRIEVESLSSILKSAQGLCETYPLRKEDAQLVETLGQCVSHCSESLSNLQVVVMPFAAGERGSGRRSPMRMISWTMHKGEVRTLKSRLRDRKASLTLAVSVLNGHLTGKGQEDIKRDMTTKYENLLTQFLNADSGRRIRRRLEDDISSVTTAINRPASIADQTDVGFTMRNYLNSYEQSTVINEPPPIEVIEDASNADGQDILEDSSQTFLQAVSAGDKVTVVKMLSRGASVMERSPDGLTALHYCALYDDRQIADVLLDHDASMNAKSNERLTPFDLAIDTHSWNVASLLIERGSVLGSFTTNIFKLLKGSDDVSAWRPVLKALAQRFNGTQDGSQLLHRALELHDSKALALFLDEGFDPNASDNGLTLLHHAILQRRKSDVELLIKHGADVNAYLPQTARQPDRKDLPRQQLLLAKDDRDFTPLLLAGGDPTTLPIFQLLLDSGADPNFFFPVVGDTHLNCYCAEYYLPFARALIKARTNLDFRDRDHGYSALFWAVVCRNPELIHLLLDHGADIDIKTHRNTGALTPLHQAVSVNHIPEAKILVQRGADLNIRDADGLTPLERAKRYRHEKMVELLSQGA